ncbi:MAG TPA: hypothetical protein VF817_04585 [Patescibacteria group bacterium]
MKKMSCIFGAIGIIIAAFFVPNISEAYDPQPSHDAAAVRAKINQKLTTNERLLAAGVKPVVIPKRKPLFRPISSVR